MCAMYTMLAAMLCYAVHHVLWYTMHTL